MGKGEDPLLLWAQKIYFQKRLFCYSFDGGDSLVVTNTPRLGFQYCRQYEEHRDSAHETTKRGPAAAGTKGPSKLNLWSSIFVDRLISSLGGFFQVLRDVLNPSKKNIIMQLVRALGSGGVGKLGIPSILQWRDSKTTHDLGLQDCQKTPNSSGSLLHPVEEFDLQLWWLVNLPHLRFPAPQIRPC